MPRVAFLVLSAAIAMAFTSTEFRGNGARAEALTPEQYKKVSTLYQEARSHQLQKEYGKSNDVYGQVLAALPASSSGFDRNRAGVHYNMGVNYTLLEKKKEAFESLDKAVGHGYSDHEYLMKDESLKALHKEKEFQAIVDKARKTMATIPWSYADAMTGKKLERKDFEGQVLILDVWGTWCPPCRAEIPHIVRLQEKYRDKGLRIVGLTYERSGLNERTKQRVSEFASDNKVNYPLIFVGEDLVGSLGVSSFPTTIFIGRDGVVAERILGLHPYSTLEAIAVKLLEKK